MVITFKVSGGEPELAAEVKVNFKGSSVPTENLILTAAPDTINITRAGENRVLDLYLSNTTTHQPVEGQEIIAHVFDQNKGRLSHYSATTDVNGHVTFGYAAPESLPTADLTITFEVLGGTPVLREDVTVKFGTPTVPTENTATHQPVEGQQIIAHVFDPNKGTLDRYTSTTSNTGRAIFTYEAPDTLPTSDLIITFEVAGGTPVLTEDVTVTFITTTEYELLNTNDITVHYASESKELAIQLVKNGIPQTGELVSVKSVPVSFGRIERTAVVTGTDGYARFTYIAADSLQNGTVPVEFVYTDMNGVETNASATITVAAASNPFQYDLRRETTPVVITTGNQVEEVSVYVVDSATGVGVSGKTVEVSLPGFGDFTSASAVTDVAGKAVFIYQAPGILVDGAHTTVTLSFIENGTTIARVIDINVTVSTETSEYNLTNQTTPVNVQYAAEQKEVKVQLVKMNGDIVSGETVYAKSIPSAFGRLQSASAVTDGGGYATFIYIAADPLTDGTTPLELYHEDENGIRVNAIVDINVTETNVPLDYNLTYETSPIIITQTDQQEEISVYVIDNQTGAGVPGKTVSIAAIDGMYGEITPASTTTDVAGKATFQYTSPHDINGTPLNVTTVVSFTDSEVTLTRDIEIRIVPTAPASDYALVNQSDINGTIGVNETMETEIQLVKNGLPVLDARACVTTTDTVTVDCLIPASIPREYGRIIGIPAQDGTEGSGYVKFRYLAPTDAIEISNYQFPMYYIDQEGKIAAEANITIDLNVTDGAANPPIDTTEMALSAVPDELNVTAAGESRVVSVYLSNTNTHSEH